MLEFRAGSWFLGGREIRAGDVVETRGLELGLAALDQQSLMDLISPRKDDDGWLAWRAVEIPGVGLCIALRAEGALSDGTVLLYAQSLDSIEDRLAGGELEIRRR